MSYRIYKGEEYYGRDIHYAGKLVLWCNDCGYVGTYDSEDDVEKAKSSHDRLHNEERVE